MSDGDGGKPRRDGATPDIVGEPGQDDANAPVLPPPGWYLKDGLICWWTGSSWSEHVLPSQEPGADVETRSMPESSKDDAGAPVRQHQIRCLSGGHLRSSSRRAACLGLAVRPAGPSTC